jgi:hypothetical protein
MRTVHIVDERSPYLLVASGDDRFGIVERRAGKLYSLRCGQRTAEPLTDTGAEHAVGDDWRDERTAWWLFVELTARYRRLAETIW